MSSSSKARRIIRQRQAGGEPAAVAAPAAPTPVDVPPSRLRGSPVVRSRRIAPEQEVLAGAERRARDLVAEAEREARAILDRAEFERTGAIEQGQQRGYQEGYAAGQQVAEREMTDALQLVRSIASEAKVVRDTILSDTEPQILRLTAAATRSVVGGLVEQHPELVLEAVQRALRLTGDQEVLRLRVHPESQQLVEARFGPDAQGWTVQADAGLALGGCIIDTAAGLIDASVEGQTAEIAAGWLEAV